MNIYIGRGRSSTLDHFVSVDTTRKPYRGMTAQALCGARVAVDPDSTADSGVGIVQPVGTCKRCATVLGQTVRKVGA